MRRLIDAHVHVFETLKGFNGKGELRPIGGGRGRFANGEVVDMIPAGMGETAFTADTCYQFLKEQGVEKAVLLQGSFYGFQNEYAVEAAQKYPDMFLPIGTFDPFGSYADVIYERLTKEMHVTGMKFELSTGCGITSYHNDFDIAEKMDRIAANCEKNDQTLVLDIGSPGMTSFQTGAVATLARKYPGLKIVVCHLLAPTLKDEEALKRGLEELALLNVWFDLAAIPHNVQPEVYPYPTGIRYIALAKEIVGYEKLIWGTDIPSVLFRANYQELLNYFTEASVFDERELDAVLYGNALEVYHFE